VETATSLVGIAEKAVEAAQSLIKAGLGNQPDLLRAQVELEQVRVQHDNAVTRFDVAWRRLAFAAALPDLPPCELVGTLAENLPAYSLDALRAEMLARSSQVRDVHARILQAEQALRHANAMKYPNIVVQAVPFYSTFERDTRVDLGARVDLPIFNRNQGNIYAAQSQLAAVTAEAGQLELRLSDQLADVFRRYEVARQRVEAFRVRVLPRARESVRLVRIGYASGDPKYNYTTLLQSQQVLFQSEVLSVEALGEAWRTAAELGGLLQWEQFSEFLSQ
jgi:cobalt-zinc-cadmium efflux system outer membrane protein